MVRTSGKLNECGQALIEWVIFGTSVFTLWLCSAVMAKHLLTRTIAESWSLLAARHTLSGIPTAGISKMGLMKKADTTGAEAVVWHGGARVRSTLALPEDKEEASFFNLPSFGSPFSLSSE